LAGLSAFCGAVGDAASMAMVNGKIATAQQSFRMEWAVS
jgi:hypothetical protein